MSQLQLLRAQDYPRMPWKNGGGFTEEITRDSGEGLEGFGWRLSIADIEESGGFSLFAGYQRIITVLQGDGMRLLRDRIVRHQIECDWRDGHASVPIKPRQERMLRAGLIDLAQRYDYPLQWWDRTQLRGQLGNAQSYAERLFDFPEIGALPKEAATQAIEKPINDEGVAITPPALQEILRVSQGYAYFLQTWGSHTWLAADTSPIDIDAVRKASITAIAGLDEGFFRVRFDRCTPKEKKYLRAMAELGEGPHRSGDIADCLNEKVSSLAPTRSALIGKGMVWSPNHGDTAFTVPMFDAFMKRIIPGADWK